MPVRIGRQIGDEQPEHREGDENPAVATVLSHAGAEASAGEKSGDGYDEKDDREYGERRMGEESREPAPAEDGEAEIGGGACENEQYSGGESHYRWIGLGFRACPLFGER